MEIIESINKNGTWRLILPDGIEVSVTAPDEIGFKYKIFYALHYAAKIFTQKHMDSV